MNNIIKKGAAFAAMFGGAIASAYAELPPEVDAAVTTAKADVTEAGGLILGVVVLIAAVGWVRRVVR
jgi:Inovirus Coat protein B